jgi:hypothetical protein
MMQLVRSMRQAILENRYPTYVQNFVMEMFPGKDKGGEDCPQWVVDALSSAGISLQNS